MLPQSLLLKSIEKEIENWEIERLRNFWKWAVTFIPKNFLFFFFSEFKSENMFIDLLCFFFVKTNRQKVKLFLTTLRDFVHFQNVKKSLKTWLKSYQPKQKICFFVSNSEKLSKFKFVLRIMRFCQNVRFPKMVVFLAKIISKHQIKNIFIKRNCLYFLLKIKMGEFLDSDLLVLFFHIRWINETSSFMLFIRTTNNYF